jgi:SAM-dependent methyltransferase
MAKSHLGGHLGITHLDYGALDWAIEEFNAKSLLDVGCGLGGMVDLSLQKGLRAHGVDGDPSVVDKWSNPSMFTLNDYEKGNAITDKVFDLCWSVEFVEHVYEKYMENFIRDFQSCKYIMITHALPGQPGHHHVNCKTQDYWIENLSRYKLVYNENYTKTLREKSTMNVNIPGRAPWMKKTGLFFVNEGMV